MPSDILLIIEVIDSENVCASTIDFDCNIKIPLYAEFGILAAWVIDAEQKTLLMYSGPKENPNPVASKNPGRYKKTESLNGNDVVLVLEIEIAVKDILRS